MITAMTTAITRRWTTGLLGLLLINLAFAKPTVIHNVIGHSLEGGQLINFEAIAFEGSMIKEVGSSEQLLNTYKDAQLIDG